MWLSWQPRDTSRSVIHSFSGVNCGHKNVEIASSFAALYSLRFSVPVFARADQPWAPKKSSDSRSMNRCSLAQMVGNSLLHILRLGFDARLAFGINFPFFKTRGIRLSINSILHQFYSSLNKPRSWKSCSAIFKNIYFSSISSNNLHNCCAPFSMIKSSYLPESRY